MENRVITIARSYGSGGRKMGRLLAKELGYEYYDREILRIASDESGISEELFNQVDERQHLPLFRIAREAYTGEVIPPDSDDFISNENLFRYQAKIDKRRADYFKYFTGRQWHDAALYDLCLNTGHMSEQKCVDIVRAYMEARFD